jgi:hypothetical protein
MPNRPLLVDLVDHSVEHTATPQYQPRISSKFSETAGAVVEPRDEGLGNLCDGRLPCETVRSASGSALPWIQECALPWKGWFLLANGVTRWLER